MIRGFADHYRQRGGARQAAPAGTGLAPAEVDRMMARISQESSRMGVLVEDLLMLARLDRERPLDLGPVDLLALAADAVQDARIIAPDRAIDLAIEPGTAFIVDGDEGRLRQVLGNLVGNALAHTPAGSPVRVTLQPHHPGIPAATAVTLSVMDQGPGLTPAQQARVFDRFYRADKARTSTAGRTGLGLAIVAALVRAHHGMVSVDSREGQGSTFQVILPLHGDTARRR